MIFDQRQKRTRELARIFVIMIPLFVILCFLMRSQIAQITVYFPTCIFYEMFHLYCPACGNTRCILSLLQGDIITSIQYNITPWILMILGGLLYIELLMFSFGKHKKILPRKALPYYVLISIVFIYYIVRNLYPEIFFPR